MIRSANMSTLQPNMNEFTCDRMRQLMRIHVNEKQTAVKILDRFTVVEYLTFFGRELMSARDNCSTKAGSID